MLDVVVIGGGPAGLSAAYKLKQADLRIVVLEAQDRVGGRTLTQPVDVGQGKTEMFDLGGQWVGSSQKHVMDMLRELDLETYPQYTTGTKVMQIGLDNEVRTYSSDIPPLGSLRGLIEFQLFLWRVERMAAQTPIQDPYRSPHAKELDGHTVDTFARKHSHTLAFSKGTDATRISAMFFLAYSNAAGGVMKILEAKKDCAQEARVKGGTQQISQLLAERLGKEVVLLSHPVIRVDQTTENVKVTTENGKTFVARRVIVTAPPNMINKMEFLPPLPPYKKLIYENLPVGHLIKFLVVYEKAFWREKGFSGEVVSNGGNERLPKGVSCGPLSVCFDATTPGGTAAIVGFIAARQGVEWQGKTHEERKTAVLEGLAATLGSEGRDCVSYTEKIWAEEPYVGGCPVVFGVPGTMYAFPHLRLPHDRVHFAGTETSTEWTGFISGAIQSGQRAATEVLKNLRPEMVSEDDLKGTCYDPESLPGDYKTNQRLHSDTYKMLLIVAVIIVFIAVVYAMQL
ncbi:probable flavin-containing monoamine oxidase A [Penaeus japonicus]|uniref:probable flavin-containing monoamine oxidase A n=1 Tax=Penaeus japonicus TaxID=27405 RepID=UPI001C7111A5|nr:probable flavin-containing monoamine oxidase A [Penaeus japonicus]